MAVTIMTVIGDDRNVRDESNEMIVNGGCQTDNREEGSQPSL